MRGAFAWGVLEGLEVGVEVRKGRAPRAFSSLQACSQALASREEMYTFAPFSSSALVIMSPIPIEVRHCSPRMAGWEFTASTTCDDSHQTFHPEQCCSV